jgi:hypothetical protein
VGLYYLLSVIGGVETLTLKGNRRRGPDPLHTFVAVIANRVASFLVDRALYL